MKHVTIYTDGCCIGNPGPGGYGIILVHGRTRKELSGGFRLTTNNRMEITAAIKGLRALKHPSKVTLYSDSRYLVDAMQLGWAEKWEANGWKRNKKETALNPDLWRELLELTRKHDVQFEWVKGHAGHPQNERCDYLSNQEALKKNLPADPGYENPSVPSPLFD